MPDAPAHGTLERLSHFRDLARGLSTDKRTTAEDAVNAACSIAEAVGPNRLSVVWFDGTIVLSRRWPSYLRNLSGRDVELHPDGTMTLLTDYLYESTPDEAPPRTICVEDAAAWLAADTRARGEETQDTHPRGGYAAQECYLRGYRDALSDAEASVSRLSRKPGAHLEHGVAAIRQLASQLPSE